MDVFRKILIKILSRTFRMRWARRLFAYHYYKSSIAFCERVIAVRKDEAKLDEQYWAARLRKFAHIIDKGIQSYDYEVGRSAKWYQDALQALKHIESAEMLNDPSVIWCRNKIEEYEKRQKSPLPHPTVAVTGTCCTYKDLLDAIKTRRSVRRYSKRAVSKEIVEKIVEVVNWSPASCNRQTARVFATNDSVRVQKCKANCAGATCFSDYVPLFLSFCADVRAYEMPHEIMLPYVDVALGVQNCNLIAHSLGISITVLTWAQHLEREEVELRHLLDIPEYCQIVVNALAGYPACGAEVPGRKALSLTYSLKENNGG